MGDGKSEVEVARIARDNFEKQWKYYQSLSSYNQRAYRRENGILRDAKSGKEFHNYVRKEIDKAHDKEACAANIIRDLMKDPTYLVNSITDMDGRRGLSILIDDWQGEAKLRGVIRDAMNKQGKEYAAQHQKIFDQNFKRYAQDFKEEVEKRGQYKVERVYYIRRDSNMWESEKFNEIRAEIRQIVAKHETKSGETKKIFSSEKKDIPIALFDRIRGDFVPQDYIHRKDKPLEKDFADWVAESVVDFGIGAIVRATGKILMKGGEIAVKGISKEVTRDAIEAGVKKVSSGGGKFVEKGLVSRAQAVKKEAKEASDRAARADASRSLSEAVTRERMRARGPSKEVRDTAQDMGDTFDLFKFESRMSARIPPPGRLSTTRLPPLPNPRDVYGERGVRILGDDVTRKAVRIGLDAEHISDEIRLAELKAMTKTNARSLLEWKKLEILTPDSFYPLARGIAREGVKRDINMTYSLGEDTARGLIKYGHTPHDIAQRIDELSRKGMTINQIRREFADDIKLMDYYRNKFFGGEMDSARAGLNPDHVPSAGDVKNAIGTQIWTRLTNRYKRALDAKHGRTGVWTELPDKMQRQILGDLAHKSDKITERLAKRILGSTPAIVPLSALRRDRSVDEEEKKRIEEAEAEKTKGKRIEVEKATPENEWVKAKSMEEAKVREIEEEELRRSADKLWLGERESSMPKGKDRSSEMEKEAKREKERLEKTRKGSPRSPEEEAARAQEQALGRRAEEVAKREALGFEGLKALQEERDAARLYYEKLESEDAKAWEEYQKEKKQYMEERGLTTEEDFEESLAYDEGEYELYEDLVEDAEESGGEGWYEGDEGGFGGEDEEAYEDKMEDEEESKARREQSGGGSGGGGESGEGGG